MAYVSRRRGMGQANCPSMQQLQGIQDCTDPCQVSNPACVNTNLQAGIDYRDSLLTQASSQNNMLMFVGFGLLALLVFGGLGRR